MKPFNFSMQSVQSSHCELLPALGFAETEESLLAPLAPAWLCGPATTHGGELHRLLCSCPPTVGFEVSGPRRLEGSPLSDVAAGAGTTRPSAVLL